MTALQISFVYANEADVLNVALFGMTAKQWLDLRIKDQILEYASEKNIGPSHIAHQMLMTPQRFNRLCHRLWGVTGSELIRRVQAGEPLVEVKEKNAGS